MAKQKNQPASEWTPSIPDDYAGQGGSYIYDPETGTRRQAPPVGAPLVGALIHEDRED